MLQKKNGGMFPVSAVFEAINVGPEPGPHGSRDMPAWGMRLTERAASDPEISGPEYARLRMWRIIMRRLRSFLVTLLMLTESPLAAESAVRICADNQISVIADSGDTAGLACSLAIEAKTRLAECGLTQTAPIQIRLLDSRQLDIAHCLATFNCTSNVIEITDPRFIEASLGEDNPYRVLPVDVIFQALISHELAHALLEQTSEGVDVPFVDHEYVAAAMELNILDPKWRTALIRAAPVSLPPKISLISELIYGFDPRKFATNAWQYFNTEPDGCERIRAIAIGNFSFAK